MAMEQKETKTKLADHFQNIPDPRKVYLIKHKLIDIITIAICAVISGAEGWNDIEEYGKVKKEWLGTVLDLSNGIPSHDTFRIVFSLLNPEEFRKSFFRWVQEIANVIEREVVAIDGKTARRSHQEGQNPLHIVSAWAQENNLVLGQTKTDQKSNEITAIPRLLEMLALEGCIITIDAMGCQKDIAEKIVEKKADYVLALKGNQGNMHREVRRIFSEKDATAHSDFHEEISEGHGRKEKRRCTRILLNEEHFDLKERSDWEGLRSIVKIESERTINGRATREIRYYLSSLEEPASRYNSIIRKHWSIENSLHWSLDVAFREDESRVRIGNSAENLGILRHMALNLLKQETTLKRGLKAKRLKAGWSSEYLFKVLES